MTKIYKNRVKFTEIEHFHPSGRKTVPNAVYQYKGSWFGECIKNRDAFKLTEGLHANQFDVKNHRGGIIVFSVEVNAVHFSDNKLVNKITQMVKTWNNRITKKSKLDKVKDKFNADPDNDGQSIFYMSVGNIFNGQYKDDKGKIYNEKSLTLEVDGLSSKGLLRLAELVCLEFNQESVLVKDLNKNKIYYADADTSDSSRFDNLDAELEKINELDN